MPGPLPREGAWSDGGASPFVIVVGNPATLVDFDPDVVDLGWATERVFPMETEDMTMVWRGVPFPLNYKYDLSEMIDDLIWMIDGVCAVPEGKLVVDWVDSGFFATWKLVWGAGQLRVEHEWRDPREPLVRRAVEALGTPITLPLADFLAEWRGPLELIRDALHAAGYTPSEVEGLTALGAAIAKLPPRVAGVPPSL